MNRTIEARLAGLKNKVSGLSATSGTLLSRGGVITGVSTIPPPPPVDWGALDLSKGFDSPTPDPTTGGTGGTGTTPPATPPATPTIFTTIDEAFSQYDQLKITLANDDDLIKQMEQAAIVAHQKATEADNNVVGANTVKQNDLSAYQSLLMGLITALQVELAKVSPSPVETEPKQEG